jgi:arylsulfatase
VVITIDTLRFDAVSDHSGSRMPLTQDRFEQCASFDRCYSSTSTTQPTHATLFTNRHPWDHGVTRNGVVLDSKYVTLAEVLKGAGFATVAVVASVPVSRIFGFDQGFDVFRDEFTHVQLPGSRGVSGEKYYSLARTVTDEAISLLDGLDDVQKQFLWVHYFDPHAPYGDTNSGETIRPMPLVKEIVEGRRERETAIQGARMLYEADIQFMDDHLDRLLARLENEFDRFDTHVVFTADHGESFGEDGSMAHGRRLTVPQIHVPLSICSPSVAPGSYSEVVGSIDFMPTVLSLAGLQSDSGPGRDLTRPVIQEQLIVGMRTTQRYRELRLDGRIYDLSDNLFYAVNARGVIVRGNQLQIDDSGLTAASNNKFTKYDLKHLFGSFENALEESTGETLTDPEIIDALRALGYAN